MSKITTIKTPCGKDGKSTEFREVSGQVMWLKVGSKRVKFFLQDNGRFGHKTLTHYASGFKFCSLQATINEHHRTGYRLTHRAAAEIKIAKLIADVGLNKVLVAMRVQPVINS